MAEKVELNLKTDSQVALDLFYRAIAHKTPEELSELFKDTEKLLKMFANFVYTVKHCEPLHTIEK